jgi:hypothetical protein
VASACDAYDVYVVSVMLAAACVCVMTVDADWLVNSRRSTVVSLVAFLGNWPRTTSRPSSGKILAI